MIIRTNKHIIQFMKSVILIILISLLMASCIGIKKANERFINICKTANDTIHVDYMDSSHGIVSIDKELNNDTLFLKIYVGLYRPSKIFQINPEQVIRYVNTGNQTYIFDEMDTCPKIYTGAEGIEYLKSQRRTD